MKRFIIGSGLAIALILGCIRLNGAPASDKSPQSASSSAATIPSGQVFIMQLDTSIHTRTTKKGDKVEFSTAADVVIDNRILIPNQSLVRAEVKKSKRAGGLSGRAEVQLRIIDVKLPDGTVLPIKASLTRAGLDPVESETGKDSKLQGDAARGADARAAASAGAQGAVMGVLYGGLKGGLYGAGAGAAASVIGNVPTRSRYRPAPRYNV